MAVHRDIDTEKYDDWMREVDKIVSDRTPFSMADLCDWLSRDTFDSGATPEEGFEALVEADDLLQAFMEGDG